VSTGFNDMFRLDGTDKGIPAEPSRPARLLRADPPARISRQPRRHMIEELLIVRQLLNPGTHLSDRCSGHSGNEPTELVTVERVQIIGKISGLAATHQPIDRPSYETSVITRNHCCTQRKRCASGNSRSSDAASKLRLHFAGPPVPLAERIESKAIRQNVRAPLPSRLFEVDLAGGFRCVLVSEARDLLILAVSLISEAGGCKLGSKARRCCWPRRRGGPAGGPRLRWYRVIHVMTAERRRRSVRRVDGVDLIEAAGHDGAEGSALRRGPDRDPLA
jgi:hypothetical protein